MSSFKIGQRVKKVSGHGNIGLTGVVNGGPTGAGQTLQMSVNRADFFVAHDAPCSLIDGRTVAAGYVVMAVSGQYEPILPEGAAPSEYSFSELMDSLRETVK